MVFVHRIANYLAEQSARTLICIGTVLPIMLAVLWKFEVEATRLQLADAGVAMIFLFTIGTTLAILWWGFCSKKDPIPLLLASLVLALVGRITFIIFVQTEPVSDYATMWNYARTIIEVGGFEPATSAPEKRTLAYLLPVAWLSEGAAYGYKVANFIMGLATIGLTFLIGKTAFNARIGVIAATLAALAPEPLAATVVPTHDVPGNFYMLVGLWIGMLLAKQIKYTAPPFWKITALSLALGLTIALADIVRGTGLFLLLGWLIYAVIIFVGSHHRDHRFIMVLLVCIALPVLTSSVTKKVVHGAFVGPTYSDIEARGTYRWITAYAGQESVGDYQDIRHIQPYVDELDNEELKRFSLNLFASDLSHNYQHWPKKYANKAMRLFNLGNQHSDYFSLQDDKLSRAGSIPAYHRWYNQIFSILLLILATPAIILYLMFERSSSEAYLPLLVLSLISTALIVLGEIQSHYMSLAWFILPLYLAWMLEKMRVRQLSFIGLKTGTGSLTGFLFITGITVSLAGAITLNTYTYNDGRILRGSDWNPTKPLADAFSTYGIRLYRDVENDEAASVSTELKLGATAPYKLNFFASGGITTGGDCTANLTIQTGQQTDFVERTFLGGRPEFIELSSYTSENGVLPIAINYTPTADATNSCDWVAIEYLSIN